jgi:hypothetical protein
VEVQGDEQEASAVVVVEHASDAAVVPHRLVVRAAEAALVSISFRLVLLADEHRSYVGLDVLGEVGLRYGACLTCVPASARAPPLRLECTTVAAQSRPAGE